MFTGIVEGEGKVLNIVRKSNEITLRIQPLFKIDGYKQGESISVNGACLTVITSTQDWFETYVSSETLSRTNLGNLSQGKYVNLERALSVGDRLSGHFVTGHIDTLAIVVKITQSGASKLFKFSFDQTYSPFLVEKGSVALEGISLTINTCHPGYCEINAIPETLQNTTLSKWQVGYQANMETDLIGKHVYQMLNQQGALKTSKLSKQFLLENGF